MCVAGTTGCVSNTPTYTYTDKPIYLGENKLVWVFIDQHFDPFEKMQISEALASWNKALNGYIELKPVLNVVQEHQPDHPGDNDWVIQKVVPRAEVFPKVDAGSRVLGVADSVGGHYIFLASDVISIANLYYVSMHEMGHLLGAQHQSKDLMSPHFNKEHFHCIDAQTIMQVAKAQKLPLKDLNFCTR
jgi:hypothetical protein